MTPSCSFPTTSLPVSRMGFYLPHLPYTYVMPCMNVFTLDLYVDVNTCMPVSLVEIFGHVLPYTPVLSVEMSVHSLTRYSVHVELYLHTLIQYYVLRASMYTLTWSSVYVILQAFFLVLPRVCVSNIILQASVHVPQRASLLVVAVTHACLLFCPTMFCKNYYGGFKTAPIIFWKPMPPPPSLIILRGGYRLRGGGGGS